MACTDVVGILLCAAFFTGWTWRATGTRSWAVPLAFTAICTTFYLAGAVVSAWRGLVRGLRFDLPLKLLTGYLVVNTALYALAWVSPYSIQTHFTVLFLAAGVAFMGLWTRVARAERREATPALFCCALSLLAATAWAQDNLSPTVIQGDVTVFKPWMDGFFHAAHVRMFSAAHGRASIEDFRMAFLPARFYHYAPYITPALARALAAIPSYAAFASILVPMGVFFTGLAAYALAASWWGAWPGVCALVALLLVPDAAQQGLRNTFLSYHWMQMVGPGGTYGVTVLALGWLLVLRGCASGSRLQVVCGWAVAGVTVIYKAQLSVAGAFLLWVGPPLFMRGLSLRKRLVWLASAVVVFELAVSLARRLPGIPTLRLDGSSTVTFLGALQFLADPGPLKSLAARHLGAAGSVVGLLGYGSFFLVAWTLGVFAIAYPVLAVWLRRRSDVPVLVFPGLVLVSFLVMALGLAYDDRGIGREEELLHRPFVWVYFVTAAWVGGAAGLMWFGRTRPGDRAKKVIVVAVALMLLSVPVALGRGVQRLAVIPLAYQPAPTALVRASEFVRAHAQPGDLLQDSRYDGNYLVTALSERRAYVTKSNAMVSYGAVEMQRRVEVVERLRLLTDAASLTDMARRLQIGWFLLHPGDAVSWPASVVQAPAFACDGYRVYHLDGSSGP